MVAKQAPTAQEAANENGNPDQDALGLTALAEGVLARDFRPRVASVRRLAEAVLAMQREKTELKKAPRKAAKSTTKAASGKSAKKSGKKKRKLAKIPGQNKK
ncbi:hypothetical protein [Aurantiacibacter suaedae]|uniref:hypothetical protein n=1 Tax=Aurantiacibacter suaedae TaxID=2545755 RepID=UPI0010F6B7F5|nr:hypothetical protein [Aurantiacibacter suaedae]